MTFWASLALSSLGGPPVAGEFPYKGPVMQSLAFSLLKEINKQSRLL